MNTTKRHPRTLDEAFGPYARGTIEEPYAPMTLGDKIIVALGIVTCAFVLGAIFTGII